MSFLGNLFGGPKTADPDPVPGIGGYTEGRGPAGQSGYPGSTSAVRTNPRTSFKNLRRGIPYVPIAEQQEARQDIAGEWHGGLEFNGSLSATGVGPQYQDSEQRSRPGVSSGIPGAQNQRNTVYRGNQSPPDGVNRYVYGGRNGGVESYSFERRMPYTGHGTLGNMTSTPGALRNVRGADLNGHRFGQPPPLMVAQNDGLSTARLAGSRNKKATVFTEPAPWATNVMITDAATGTPDTPGTPVMAQAVSVSPTVARSSPLRRRRG